MAVVKEQGATARVIEYTKKDQRPSAESLRSLVGKLEDPVEDLVRKDGNFKKLGLNAGDYVGNADAVVNILVAHPELLQRPVLVRGKRAIIGRPKDRVAPFVAGK